MRQRTLTIDLTEVDSLDELPALEQQLVEQARLARHRAYAPYSCFLVGAAVLLGDGTFVLGANQENASYGLTVCAERTAIWRAWLDGRATDLLGIAVTGGFADPARDPASASQPIRPCGACRQVLAEAQARAGRPLFLLLDSRGGGLVRIADLTSLLPLPFLPSDLGVPARRE